MRADHRRPRARDQRPPAAWGSPAPHWSSRGGLGEEIPRVETPGASDRRAAAASAASAAESPQTSVVEATPDRSVHLSDGRVALHQCFAQGRSLAPAVGGAIQRAARPGGRPGGRGVRAQGLPRRLDRRTGRGNRSASRRSLLLHRLKGAAAHPHPRALHRPAARAGARGRRTLRATGGRAAVAGRCPDPRHRRVPGR